MTLHSKQALAAQWDSADRVQWQAQLGEVLRDYVGRPSPLYFAPQLSKHHKRCRRDHLENDHGIDGRDIYLKREDLNHTGAHKINNSLGQASCIG